MQINNLQQLINQRNYAPHLQHMRQFDSLFEQSSSEEVKGPHVGLSCSSGDGVGHELRLRQSAKENSASDLVDMTVNCVSLNYWLFVMVCLSGHYAAADSAGG